MLLYIIHFKKLKTRNQVKLLRQTRVSLRGWWKNCHADCRETAKSPVLSLLNKVHATLPVEVGKSYVPQKKAL